MRDDGLWCFAGMKAYAQGFPLVTTPPHTSYSALRLIIRVVFSLLPSCFTIMIIKKEATASMGSSLERLGLRSWGLGFRD